MCGPAQSGGPPAGSLLPRLPLALTPTPPSLYLQARQKFNAWFVNKSAAAIQRAARLYNERARARAALKAGGVKGTIGTAALAAAQGAIRGLVLGEFNLHPSPPSSSSSSCVSSLSDGEFGAQELDAVAGTLFVAHGGAGDDLDGDYGFR